MTHDTLTAHDAGLASQTDRPRRSVGVVAAVARLMSGRPLPSTRTRASARGSPHVPRHLRSDLGLPPESDEWWRAMDRW